MTQPLTGIIEKAGFPKRFAATLSYIMENNPGTVTSREIQKSRNLKQSAVSVVLSELKSMGIVSETSTARENGGKGRRAFAYSLAVPESKVRDMITTRILNQIRDLQVAVVTINSWHSAMIQQKSVAGEKQPRKAATVTTSNESFSLISAPSPDCTQPPHHQ